jgi:hypothetical protein
MLYSQPGVLPGRAELRMPGLGRLEEGAALGDAREAVPMVWAGEWPAHLGGLVTETAEGAGHLLTASE